MHNFFITGLPRTRTAWLANFFTSTNSFCHHEPEGNYFKIIELFQKGRPESYIGMADCKLPYYFDDVAQVLNNHRLVIIERDVVEAMESLYECIEVESFEKNEIFAKMRQWAEKLEHIKRIYPHMSVDYHSLDDKSVMEEMWEFLLPGQRFDVERFEMLDKFVVEPYFDKYGEKPMNIQKVMEGI